MLLVSSGCAFTNPTSVEVAAKPQVVERIEVRTVPVNTPAPIVPNVKQLNLRNVQWVVITPENVEEKFAEIRDGETVLFAVTAEGYKALALNLSDIRANIDEYKTVIALYKASYN